MQNVKLNLIPGAVMPVVNVSQYDKARQFSLTVYEGSATYDLTGKSVQIRGTKPDGNGFAYDSTDGVVSVSGSTVTISTTQQMTAVGGQTMAELRITQSGVILGTLNFVLMVEPSALSDDTPISDTDIPAIERDFEAALAEAEADALKAEGYAVGTQDGTPAQSGEPYYQDNAKYYKEQAEAAASGGGADALKAEGYAVGTQNGVPVTSGSPYYHNNAAYYEGEASTSATNAGNSETNAGNSAAAARTSDLKSEGYAVGTQDGTPVSSGSPYYQNNAEYYCQQASQYATGGLIFKGSVAFASIPTTGMASGDMYNITDDFTTDSRFIEGAGVSVKAGANIAWVAGGTNKWDVLATGGGSNVASLDDLTDVNLTTPADGDLLQYNGTSQEWENSNAVPQELSAMQENGAYNWLYHSYPSAVVNQLTITVNADKSIEVHGTASANTYIVLNTYSTKARWCNKKVTVSGCPAGGSIATYFLQAYRVGSVDGTGSGISYADTGSGATFDWLNDASGNPAQITITIIGGTVCDHLLFKPMLYDARLVNPSYQPFTMTNRELTDNVNGLYSYVAKTFTPEAAITTVFRTGTYVTKFNYNPKTNTVFVAVSGNLNASADSPLAAGLYYIGSVDTNNMWAPTYARMGFYATRDFCATNEPFWVNNNLNKPQLRIESTSPGTFSRVFVYIPQTISNAQWVQCYFSTTVMY